MKSSKQKPKSPLDRFVLHAGDIVILKQGTPYIEKIKKTTKNKGVIIAFPKYQIYKDKSGKFRFRLFAANAKNILHSEGYNTRGACLNRIASVRRNADKKERFVINKAKSSKKVYFNLVDGNKEVVGTSQMYASRKSLYKGRDSVMKNAKSAIE